MRLGNQQADLKGDAIKQRLAFYLKALRYSDDKIKMITLTPMGFTLEFHIDDLVSKGRLTEKEANTVLSSYNSAKFDIENPDLLKVGIPEDNMKLPDKNGNLTTVSNKNYWWLYLALGVGLGLMFKKKK